MLKGRNDVNFKKVSCYSPENENFIAAPTPERKGPPRS